MFFKPSYFKVSVNTSSCPSHGVLNFAGGVLPNAFLRKLRRCHPSDTTRCCLQREARPGHVQSPALAAQPRAGYPKASRAPGGGSGQEPLRPPVPGHAVRTHPALPRCSGPCSPFRPRPAGASAARPRSAESAQLPSGRITGSFSRAYMEEGVGEG